MADGITRTPAIGLSYTSDEVMNRNLDRIDAAFAGLLPEEDTFAARAARERDQQAETMEPPNLGEAGVPPPTEEGQPSAPPTAEQSDPEE